MITALYYSVEYIYPIYSKVVTEPKYNGTKCPSNLTETEYCINEDCPEGKKNKHMILNRSHIRRCTPARSVVGIQRR